MHGRRVVGDRAAIEVQRAACLDVDCAAISGIHVVIPDRAAGNVDGTAVFNVDRTAAATRDGVAGNLAALDIQNALVVHDDRAADLRRAAAGDLDVGNIDGCVRHIQAAAVFIVYAGTLEDTGADAVREREMPFV